MMKVTSDAVSLNQVEEAGLQPLRNEVCRMVIL